MKKKQKKSDGYGLSHRIDLLERAKQIGREIEEALDPAKAPGKVRQFTPEEIARMNKKLSKT